MSELESRCCKIDHDLISSRQMRRHAQLRANPTIRGVTMATARLIRNRHAEAMTNERGRLNAYTFYADEPQSRGGSEKGPTPLEYFTAGLALCELSMIVHYAADLSVHLENVEVSVRGHLNPLGTYEVTEEGPSYYLIECDFKFESREPEERIRELISKVELHSIAYNTMKKAAKVQIMASLNGRPITYP